MKKKTIYKLLCTMVMVPGISLAAERQEQPSTPSGQPVTPLKQRSEELKRRAMADLPRTPQLQEEARRGIDRNIMTARKADLFEKIALEEKKQERDSRKKEAYARIDQQIAQERLEREQRKHEESARTQTSQHQRLIQAATEETRQKQLESERLQSTITALEERIEKLDAEFEDTKDMLSVTEAFSDRNIQKIREKSQELDDAREKLHELQTSEQLLKLQLQIAQTSEQTLKRGLEGIIASRPSSSSSSSSSSLNSIAVSSLAPGNASHSAQNTNTPQRQNAAAGTSANALTQEEEDEVDERI